MNKHTPGPWFAVADKGQTIIRTSRSSAAFSPLAIVKGDKRDTLKDQEANARLIAAAPVLLEALENMVSKAQKQNWNDNYPTELNAAYAAIAKARGEA